MVMAVVQVFILYPLDDIAPGWDSNRKPLSLEAMTLHLELTRKASIFFIELFGRGSFGHSLVYYFCVPDLYVFFGDSFVIENIFRCLESNLAPFGLETNVLPSEPNKPLRLVIIQPIIFLNIFRRYYVDFDYTYLYFVKILFVFVKRNVIIFTLFWVLKTVLSIFLFKRGKWKFI